MIFEICTSFQYDFGPNVIQVQKIYSTKSGLILIYNYEKQIVSLSEISNFSKISIEDSCGLCLELCKLLRKINNLNSMVLLELSINNIMISKDDDDSLIYLFLLNVVASTSPSYLKKTNMEEYFPPMYYNMEIENIKKSYVYAFGVNSIFFRL